MTFALRPDWAGFFLALVAALDPRREDDFFDFDAFFATEPLLVVGKSTMI
jgi:hypothetical protein